MDFTTGMRVSSSGMTANRLRMNTISSNIANAKTTRTEDGGPYKRKDVVFESVPDFKNFHQLLARQLNEPVKRVQVTEVLEDSKPPTLKYEPHHPDANEKGYVAYPNVNLMEEMVNMIQATRAYEANVSAFNATKEMAKTALEIGR